MGNHIKGFPVVKLCNIHCSSPVSTVSCFITKGNQVSEAWFLYGRSMLAISSHHLVLRDPGNGFQEYLLHTFPGIEVRFTSLQYPRSSLRLLNMGMIFDFFFPSHQKPPLIAMTLQRWLRVTSHIDISQLSQHPWMHPMKSHGLVHVQWIKHAFTVGSTSLWQTLLYVHLNFCISAMKDRKQEQISKEFSPLPNVWMSPHILNY